MSTYEVAKATAQSWLNQPIDADTRNGIVQLLSGSEDALTDAFYKQLEFGTGGMRGIMGTGSNRINKYTLGMATQGLANYLHKQFAGIDQISVAIAYDCRNNSAQLARLVADVFTANDIKAHLFSALRPTPQLSFAVRHLGCQSGVVITASHNPPAYNGYKVYWNDGAQIVAPHDKGIINEVMAIEDFSSIRFEGKDTLLEMLDPSMDEAFIQASLAQRKTQETHPLTIAFTSLHGTSITMMPSLLEAAGYKNVHIVEEQAMPDGNFPTVESPNPEEVAALKMALELGEEVGADMVIGTDPDSDRLGVAIRDEDNELILLNGNQCGVLLTDYLLEQTNLQGDEFIAYTIVSSELFRDVAVGYGVEAEICLTGFKHIADLIRKNEGVKIFIGGGEESYGYMIGDFVRDKDALTSTLLFADMAAAEKAKGSSAFKRLCKLYEKHGFYQEHLISMVKSGISGAEEIKSMMDGLRSQPPTNLGGERVVEVIDIQKGSSLNLLTGEKKTIELPTSNVLQFITEGGSKISARPSGTEPKIKFYFSLKAQWNNSQSYKAQQKVLQERISDIAKDLGV